MRETRELLQQLVDLDQAIKCEKCGEIYVIGEFPFCPHGTTKRFSMAHDEIPGGIILENYGPHPIKVYSHTERRKIMAARGLQEKEQFAPMPGTDRDPQGIPNPKGFMDPQTLENARALVSRQGEVEPDEEFASAIRPFNKTLTKEEAIATIAQIDEYDRERR